MKQTNWDTTNELIDWLLTVEFEDRLEALVNRLIEEHPEQASQRAEIDGTLCERLYRAHGELTPGFCDRNTLQQFKDCVTIFPLSNDVLNTAKSITIEREVTA